MLNIPNKVNKLCFKNRLVSESFHSETENIFGVHLTAIVWNNIIPRLGVYTAVSIKKKSPGDYEASDNIKKSIREKIFLHNFVIFFVSVFVLALVIYVRLAVFFNENL